MQAVRVHETGAAEVLRYEDVDNPKPGVGEALVKIAAGGVNYLDIYYRSGFHWGGHHKRPLPYIPGAEAAGIVVEVGPGATDVKVGDRVAYGISNGYGSYAELCAIPSWHLFHLPSSVTFETAAATMLQGMTAHYLTHSTVAVKREDTDVSFSLSFIKARERTPTTRFDFQDVKIALVNDRWEHELSAPSQRQYPVRMATDATSSKASTAIAKGIAGERPK